MAPLSQRGVERMRSFLYVLSFVFVAAAVAVVNLVLALRQNPLQGPRPLAAPAEAPGEREDPYSSKNVAPIWEVRTGEPPAGPEERLPPRPPPKTPAPEPTLPRPDLASRFELAGMMSGSRGSCVLRDRQNGKSQVLFVGDSLPDGMGKLVAVGGGRVVFDAGGREEALQFPEKDLLSSLGGAGAARAGLPASEPTCPSSRFAERSRWQQGEMGLTVSDPPVEGLEEGDRLLAVNGRSVETIEDLQAAAAPGVARLTLVRASKTVHLVARILE
ncbi:MAG: hypothetical protein HY720_09525 [Planctomycetes bacterium]|nr:hypothetical protein [Planctomycetota bacterium]